MATRSEQILTEFANPLARHYAKRYGSLKSVLSAGIVAFSKLEPAERDKMLDEANGLQTEDPSQKAAESARFCIRTFQSLNPKEQAVALQFLSADESRSVREMLNSLDPVIQAEYNKKKRKTSA